MGPFSIVNPNRGIAFEIEEGPCKNGIGLKFATDDYTSKRQRFYLGQHGSIFSAHCPGLVISSNDSDGSSTLKIFQTHEKKMKWKFVNGQIESVATEGNVLASANDSTNQIILQDKNITSDSSVNNWIRKNTRFLASNSVQPEWKQEWAVSFIDSDYNGPSLEEFIPDDSNSNGPSNTKCYNVSSAFSPSFESFARELAINDAADEDQCRKVREELGFDKDHPFDVEVKASFNEHKCDPFFTGIDNGMEALSVSSYSYA